MFYGGRLLSHLSADDNEISEFIGLRALNQNLALVMDSDRRSARDRINDTKVRLSSEFAERPGVSWVTKGREIENYIDHVALQEAVKTVHGTNYGSPMPATIYDHALNFNRAKPIRKKSGAEADDFTETNVDKVKVAREVCRAPAKLDILDLKARVAEIVDMIRAANS